MAVLKNLYLLRASKGEYSLGTKNDAQWFDGPLSGRRFQFEDGVIVDFCAEQFHRCVHGIRLKPGQVKKVKITIEEVK